MNKVTVLGTACYILINSGNGPWDCCLVNMLQRTAAVPESVWCTTIWIWWQSGSLLFGHFDSKDDSNTTRDCFNGPRDCLVSMVRRRAAVPETVMCTTLWISLQSCGLKNGSSPRDWDCMLYNYMNMVTVWEPVVWSLWFKGRQLSQGLCCAPPYEYGYSLGDCCLGTMI